MDRQRLAAVGCLLLVWASSAVAAETIELFNGKDFTGWKKRGGEANYSVEDGAVVGRSVPDTLNTFLCTEKDYGDFELEYDFKIDDTDFNSGVQIRSHGRPEGDGERVFGYQIEIDPKPERAWTAGLYFEGGTAKNEDGTQDRKAGWLYDLTKNEPARKAFHLGEWNHVKAVVNGRHFQTWLNGVPATDYTDDAEKGFFPSGFIALQVHSVGGNKETKEIRWKNIKLTPLESGDEKPASVPTSQSGGKSAKDQIADAPAKVPRTLRLLGRAVGAMFGVERAAGAADDEAFAHLIGQPAPNFKLPAAAGEAVRLEDLKGQVVVLDFWAAWYGPCVAALPELEKLSQEFAGKGVAVVGVNQQDDREAVLEMAKQRGTTFPQALDADGKVGDAYDVSAIPQAVLIDREGVVQSVYQGYAPGMRTELATKVAKLLKGESLFDAEKIAKAQADREEKREALADQISLVNPERLERLDNIFADPKADLANSYNLSEWVTFPGENQRALVVLSGRRQLAIVRPGVDKAEAINLELADGINIVDFCPVRVGDQMRWALLGAEHNEDYDIKHFTLSLYGSDGKSLWTKTCPALAIDSYPSADLVAGNLAGDENDEIALLVNHDGLSHSGLSGPEGATRVLSVFDSIGEELVRSWVPGTGDAAMFVLPETDGGKLLMRTAEGLTRFRLKPAQGPGVATTTLTQP